MGFYWNYFKTKTSLAYPELGSLGLVFQKQRQTETQALMPRHKRNKRPFHRINHWLLNAQIGRKNNAFPLPPLFITSANLFYREMKLFLSREQTFFITIKNAKHKLFNNINPYLRKSIPTLCTTKKRPAMTSTNTAKCKNGRFHRILSPISSGINHTKMR